MRAVGRTTGLGLAKSGGSHHSYIGRKQKTPWQKADGRGKGRGRTRRRRDSGEARTHGPGETASKARSPHTTFMRFGFVCECSLVLSSVVRTVLGRAVRRRTRLSRRTGAAAAIRNGKSVYRSRSSLFSFFTLFLLFSFSDFRFSPPARGVREQGEKRTERAPSKTVTIPFPLLPTFFLSLSFFSTSLAWGSQRGFSRLLIPGMSQRRFAPRNAVGSSTLVKSS